uniref:Uncharacterized protein n=1 Tax=Setaria italica TaxID=4555 RepID=K3YNI4_SETIT
MKIYCGGFPHSFRSKKNDHQPMKVMNYQIMIHV